MAGRPQFPYFDAAALDPLMRQTGSPCECCGATAVELYTGPFYAHGEVEGLCLDCIASGRAAARFDGSFNDVVVEFDGQVIDAEAAKVPSSIIEEITLRTPGYETWQGNPWMFHCGDGGVFQGDATAEAVANASSQARAHWEANNSNPWDEVMDGYRPGTGLGVYHFVCRQCGMDLFHWDCD